MKRARVLTLIDSVYYGGAESRVFALARSIDRTKFDHYVGVLNREDPDRAARLGSLRPEFGKLGINLVDFNEPSNKVDLYGNNPLKLVHGLVAFHRIVAKLRRFILAHGIELVDSHLWTANLVGTAAGRLCGIRTVVTQYQNVVGSPVLFSMMKLFVKMADVLVCDSYCRAIEVAKASRKDAARVHVIPNGIEPPTSIFNNVQMRERLGLPLDRRVRIIGQISGLHEYKGHLVLVEAARKVIERHNDVAFLFVGFCRRDHDYPARLQGRIDQLGLSRHIRTLGYNGPIGDVWQAIDIHVHASLFDSLPIAISEGMALGKPAVVTSVGGIPSLVEHEATGLVVPPGDADALAGALLRLLKEPHTAQRLGDAAQRRYLSAFQSRDMSARLEALFTNTLGGHANRVPEFQYGACHVAS